MKGKIFLKESLIQKWPNLHKSYIVWLALVISTLSSIINVFLSGNLDRTSSPDKYTLIILLIVSLSEVSSLLSSTIISWICVIEENTVRKKLVGLNKNTSLANIDLPIAITTIHFYIMLPAQISTVLIYGFYIFYRSPITIVYILSILIIMAFPLYRYYCWRRKMIRVVRTYRNKLVDEHDSGFKAYSDIVTHYSKAKMVYFWGDIKVAYLYKFVVFLFLLWIINSEHTSANAFSLLVILFLLINSIHALFQSITLFQEDKLSLNKIKEAI